MKNIIASHTCNAFLKPGEVIVSANPILVSTVLGACVAVTMYSNETGVGSICHAMLPNNDLKQADNLLYVDTAIRYLHYKMVEYDSQFDMEVKLFGGAQVLSGDYSSTTKRSVGEQNILQATKTLDQLGLQIAKTDTGGRAGRKLFFSIKNGDVYLRKLKLSGIVCACTQGLKA